MDGCGRGKILGRYHNMVFGLFNKMKGFNKLLWLKTWTDEWMK